MRTGSTASVCGARPDGSHAKQRRLEPWGIVYHSPARKGFQLKEAGPEGGQPGVQVSPHPAGALIVAQASIHLPWVLDIRRGKGGASKDINLNLEGLLLLLSLREHATTV